LVIAGKKGWMFKEIFEFIKNKNFEKEIIFLNYVDEKDLSPLINASEFLVYPSLYEGFGLPVLEAMACSKAVATSKISSIPEVALDSVLYFDPKNEIEIADKMFKLIKNNELRSELEKKAILQAKKFSWEKCAKETMGVYNLLSK
jgi:glycosyltransferase involved in cell wall biosynthesis